MADNLNGSIQIEDNAGVQGEKEKEKQKTRIQSNVGHARTMPSCFMMLPEERGHTGPQEPAGPSGTADSGDSQDFIRADISASFGEIQESLRTLEH